jgi:hypothetical protein
MLTRKKHIGGADGAAGARAAELLVLLVRVLLARGGRKKTRGKKTNVRVRTYFIRPGICLDARTTS